MCIIRIRVEILIRHIIIIIIYFIDCFEVFIHLFYTYVRRVRFFVQTIDISPVILW